MRHVPVAIDRIAVESSCQEIANSAIGHAIQRVADQLPFSRVQALGIRYFQEKGEVARHRELGSAAETTPLLIELTDELFQTLIRDVPVQSISPIASRRRQGTYRLGKTIALLDQFGPPRLPKLANSFEQRRETHSTIPVFRREVGSTVEGLQIGRQPNAHRPPSTAGRRLYEGHVNPIDIGALLAVDLHIDEAIVHQFRSRIALEALVSHHMTPVTSRVADRQEYRNVPSLRFLESRFAPLLPVDWIARVLQQIGGTTVSQSVSVF